MRSWRRFGFGTMLLLGVALLAQSPSLREQNEVLFRQLQSVHGLSDAQMSAIRNIFAKSGYMGQGNPAITRHPVTPEEAQAKTESIGDRLCESRIREDLRSQVHGAALQPRHSTAGRCEVLH